MACPQDVVWRWRRPTLAAATIGAGGRDHPDGGAAHALGESRGLVERCAYCDVPSHLGATRVARKKTGLGKRIFSAFLEVRGATATGCAEIHAGLFCGLDDLHADRVHGGSAWEPGCGSNLRHFDATDLELRQPLERQHGALWLVHATRQHASRRTRTPFDLLAIGLLTRDKRVFGLNINVVPARRVRQVDHSSTSRRHTCVGSSRAAANPHSSSATAQPAAPGRTTNHDDRGCNSELPDVSVGTRTQRVAVKPYARHQSRSGRMVESHAAPDSPAGNCIATAWRASSAWGAIRPTASINNPRATTLASGAT